MCFFAVLCTRTGLLCTWSVSTTYGSISSPTYLPSAAVRCSAVGDGGPCLSPVPPPPAWTKLSQLTKVTDRVPPTSGGPDAANNVLGEATGRAGG